MIINSLKKVKRVLNLLIDEFIQRNSNIIVNLFFLNIWELRKILKKNKGISNSWKLKLYYAYMAKYGSWIGIGAQLSDVPILPHGLFGIFISNNAKIGKNVVIFQHVTIGSNTTIGSRSNGSPVIEDNVYIGCGAKIIGNVHIGRNVRIGANCIVVKDIPSNSIVVLTPPRIIDKREKLDNRFISVSDSHEANH